VRCRPNARRDPGQATRTAPQADAIRPGGSFQKLSKARLRPGWSGRCRESRQTLGRQTSRRAPPRSGSPPAETLVVEGPGESSSIETRLRCRGCARCRRCAIVGAVANWPGWVEPPCRSAQRAHRLKPFDRRNRERRRETRTSHLVGGAGDHVQPCRITTRPASVIQSPAWGEAVPSAPRRGGAAFGRRLRAPPSFYGAWPLEWLARCDRGEAAAAIGTRTASGGRDP